VPVNLQRDCATWEGDKKINDQIKKSRAPGRFEMSVAGADRSLWPECTLEEMVDAE